MFFAHRSFCKKSVFTQDYKHTPYKQYRRGPVVHLGRSKIQPSRSKLHRKAKYALTWFSKYLHAHIRIYNERHYKETIHQCSKEEGHEKSWSKCCLPPVENEVWIGHLPTGLYAIVVQYFAVTSKTISWLCNLSCAKEEATQNNRKNRLASNENGDFINIDANNANFGDKVGRGSHRSRPRSPKSCIHHW